MGQKIDAECKRDKSGAELASGQRRQPLQPHDFVLDAGALVAGIHPGEPFYIDARAALEILTRRELLKN